MRDLTKLNGRSEGSPPASRPSLCSAEASGMSSHSEFVATAAELRPVPTPKMADLSQLDLTWSFLSQALPDDLLGLVMYAQAMTLAMAELKARIEALEEFRSECPTLDELKEFLS